MIDNNIDRIAILNKNVKGDLSRCNICNINFTAIQPCINLKTKLRRIKVEYPKYYDKIVNSAKNNKEDKNMYAPFVDLMKKEMRGEEDE